MGLCCLISAGRSGSTLIIDILQKFKCESIDLCVYSEIFSSLSPENILNLNIKNFLYNNFVISDNTVFKYVYCGNELVDKYVIRELSYLDCFFIHLDRNFIDSHISDKISKKNNIYSVENTSLETVDLDIEEIYDCINGRIQNYNFLINSKINVYNISYEDFIKNKSVNEIIHNLNLLLNVIYKTKDLTYLLYDNKQKVLQKQNKHENNLYNIDKLTNNKHCIKNKEVFEKKINIICQNVLVKKYYNEFIKNIIDCDATINIINTEYYLKANSNIKTYFKKKNYIFLCDDKIIINICFNINEEIEIIKDNNLFVKFSDYDYLSELNKIYDTYKNNIMLLKNNLNSDSDIKFTKNAFIVHLDFDHVRCKYIQNVSTYFENMYFVKAISYKEDENVFNLCNYFIYKKFYNKDNYYYNEFHSYTFGSICLALSNIIILNYCINNSLDNFLILEDDIILNKNMFNINSYYDSLPKNTDISYWGIKQDFREKLHFINDKWYKRNKYSWGTHSYLVHNCVAANKLLKKYSSFYTCIDCYDLSDLNCYVSNNNFFITDEINLTTNIKNITKDSTNENFWNYNLSEYNYIKNSNFVVFGNELTCESTWDNFVNALKKNENSKLKIDYNTKNIEKQTIVFFDFVDREFGWDFYKFKETYPDGVTFWWGGIVHHPFLLNSYWGNNLCVNDYLNIDYVKKSLKKCKFLIVLSDHLKNEIINSGILNGYNIDIQVLYHIMPLKNLTINFNKPKYLTFTGWSFRNYTLFLNVKTELKKIIKPGCVSEEQYQRFNNILNIHNANNININNIEILKYTSYDDYLDLISNSICFVDFDGVSANNSVLECIKYNVPLIVRDLEATRFYLGKDYPLYFNNINDINIIINDINKIQSAVNYLKQLDKLKFSFTYNIIKTLDIIQTHS
jgi:hypothetical protein